MQLSEFMNYLAQQDDTSRLPSLTDLSRELNISVASLREQMEVARALGLVEVRPRTGIRRREYEFRPAVRRSLDYALAVNPTCFEHFADLRAHIEVAYWQEAVSLLTAEDKKILQGLVERATASLKEYPPQVPHSEHRQLHLMIYSRMGNPFVTGILEAYWEAYEASGLNTFTDYAYLQRVWHYHRRMVDAILDGDIDGGHRLLVEHMGLLQERKSAAPRHTFE